MITHETNLKVCWPLKGFHNQFPGKIKTPFIRWLSLLGGKIPVVIKICRVALLTPHLQNTSYDLLNQITCSHFVWSIFILLFVLSIVHDRTQKFQLKQKNIFVENKILNKDKTEPQNLPCIIMQAWFKNLRWRAINTVCFLYKYILIPKPTSQIFPILSFSILFLFTWI